MFTLYSFYRSEEWQKFREIIIAERTQTDGFIYDEITGKPILHRYDLILHHKTELTEENVNDYNISLNPDNIQVVSHRTHNEIHDRFGYSQRQVYLVYGAPLSGKTTWVSANKMPGDLIVDMDSIWQCISGMPRYIKPNRLKSIAFKMRDALIDSIKYRQGKWSNAYLIGGYAMQAERERISKELQAREIFIDATEEECLQRLADAKDGRQTDEWERYIREWFRMRE